MSESRPDIERIQDQSPNVRQEQLARLQQLFPQFFAEGKLDWDKLRAELGDLVDERPERYTFGWAGKQAAIRLVQTPTRATLLPCRDESIRWDQTCNVFVEGENLEVLKLLGEMYAGRVKTIYIDPPYNTGGDFVYPDDFADPLGAYLEFVGHQDAQGNRLTSNPDTAGRFHSAWLTMMYPRLFFAHKLLSDDGVIFVSIDDHEVHNLRMLLNERFGEENFIAEMVWEGALKNDSRFVSISHDYVLVYARNKEHLRVNEGRWRTRKEGIDAIYAKAEELKRELGEDYDAVSEALRAWYGELPKNDPAWQHRHYSRVDARGVYFPSDISWPGGGGPKYEVLHPVTHQPVRVPARGWVYPNPQRMQEMIDDDRVYFGPDETRVPTLKRYLHETEGQVLPSVFYKDRRGAMKRLRDLFGADVFENPKDEEVLMKLIEATTGEDDIVLDFFAGSGTTAHAVLQLNRLDGGHRRFILVQYNEAFDPVTLPDGTVLTNIAQTCKERIRRVIRSFANGEQASPDDQDLGFRVFNLDESRFRPWEGVAHDTAEAYVERMRNFEDPLLPGCKADDVLFEIAIRERFGLECEVQPVTGVPVEQLYRVTDRDREQTMYVCLDQQVQLENLAGLQLTREDVFVCRDAALDDATAANLALQCRLKTI